MGRALVSLWQRVLGGRRTLELYCDGSAEERVGTRGGWAFVIVHADQVLVSRSGGAPSTTSLVMELEAALEGLREVVAHGWHERDAVVLVSDSSIALDIAAGRFMPKRHVALARALREAAVAARASTRWVRAHSGQRWNETVDALAHEAKVRGADVSDGEPIAIPSTSSAAPSAASGSPGRPRPPREPERR